MVSHSVFLLGSCTCTMYMYVVYMYVSYTGPLGMIISPHCGVQHATYMYADDTRIKLIMSSSDQGNVIQRLCARHY